MNLPLLRTHPLLLAAHSVRWLALIALASAAGVSVRAADRPLVVMEHPFVTVRRSSPMVELEAQFIRATGAQMQAALGAPVSGTAASILPGERVAQILTALKSSRAEFFSHPRAVAKSGQRATVEAVRELRYPVQFEPSKDKPKKFLPVSFETRNVGVTLEFEAVVGASGAVELSILPSVVSFLGFVDFTSGKPALAAGQPDALEELLKAPLQEGGIWQPIFSTEKIQTTVTMASEQTLLVGLPRIVSRTADGVETPQHAEPSSAQTYVFVTMRALAAE